jgi:hypothetical protein
LDRCRIKRKRDVVGRKPTSDPFPSTTSIAWQPFPHIRSFYHDFPSAPPPNEFPFPLPLQTSRLPPFSTSSPSHAERPTLAVLCLSDLAFTSSPTLPASSSLRSTCQSSPIPIFPSHTKVYGKKEDSFPTWLEGCDHRPRTHRLLSCLGPLTSHLALTS